MGTMEGAELMGATGSGIVDLRAGRISRFDPDAFWILTAADGNAIL